MPGRGGNHESHESGLAGSIQPDLIMRCVPVVRAGSSFRDVPPIRKGENSQWLLARVPVSAGLRAERDMEGIGQPGRLGRSAPAWRLALLLACAGCAGCVGPAAVKFSRIQYNEAYRSTNDQQLLLNIVRLRYADSPVFIDLPTITSQFELAGQGNYNGGYGNQFAGRNSLGFGGLTARDTPTLSYHPRDGREIARSLLNPLSADIFSVVNAGANIGQLLLMVVNDLNDVPNAPRATILLPTAPDKNNRFREGVRILTDLVDRDAMELLIGTAEADEDVSDPVPTDSIQGGDLLQAAKEGYVYRSRGDNRMALVKRDRGLVLKIRPAFVDSPEMYALANVFQFAPGRRVYRIKSEVISDPTVRNPQPLPTDTIYLNMRSVLQIATYLSKGVCVPAEHISCGVAPTIAGPDGRPFDWTGITAGLFCVHSSKHRPKGAEVAVHYRGYWYSIAGNDVKSRAVLAILELLFALEESEAKPGGPLLTLPLGG